MGQFNPLAVPREIEADEAGLLTDYLDSLAGAGVTVERPSLQLDSEPRNEDATATWSSVPHPQRNDKPLEIQCGAADHPSAWMLLAMMGPDRSSERYAQVINHRAFDIAMDTRAYD